MFFSFGFCGRFRLKSCFLFDFVGFSFGLSLPGLLNGHHK